MRGETFEQTRDRSHRQNETGKALALARFERGQRLTEDERRALTVWSMYGSDGYPIAKCGSKWRIDSDVYSGPLFKTKREAWCAWETFLSILIALSGLEAQERHKA